MKEKLDARMEFVNAGLLKYKLNGTTVAVAGFVTASIGLDQECGVLAGVGLIVAGKDNLARGVDHMEKILRRLNLVGISFVWVGHQS